MDHRPCFLCCCCGFSLCYLLSTDIRELNITIISVWSCVCLAYDSSSDTDALPQLVPSAATTSARLHAESAYFQNGLLRANVSWQIADDVDDEKGTNNNYLFIKLQKFCLKWSQCGLGDWERVSQTSRVEALDSDRQTLEQERGFSRISRRLGQTLSDLCQELLSADTHGFKCFQCHWKKVMGAAEWAVLVFFDSCSLSGTGTGDGTLLQIGVPQSVDHCDVPTGTASRVPWQQRQTVRPLAVVTDQTVWFIYLFINSAW